MNEFEPIITAMSSPVPPSKGAPSILPVKSIVTLSPFAALPPSALAANGRFCSAMRSTRLVDLGVGHLGDQPLELDVLEIRKLDLRQDLHRDRVVEIGLALDHRLDGVLLGRQLDLRLHRELQLLSETILSLASRTAASIVSAITERPYRRLRCPTGTLPGRKPLMRTVSLSSSSSRVDLRGRGRWPGPPRGIRASSLRKFRSPAW